MGRKLTAVTEYPGVSIIGNPNEYSIDEDAVRVPHGRPPEGQFLKETNYYELSQKDTKINDIIGTLGTIVDEGKKDHRIWGAKIAKVEEEPEEPEEEVVSVPVAKTRKRKSKAETPVVEDVPVKTYTLIWNIPGVGTIRSDYSKVIIGDGCLVIGIGKGNANVFTPLNYLENKTAVYNAMFENKTYRVLYTGITYKDDDIRMYVLIGKQDE